jgi:hypothetical protein
MGVFQNIRALFLMTLIVLLCGTLWLVVKFVVSPGEGVAVAATSVQVPGQALQTAPHLPIPPGQAAMQKSMERVFSDVSHSLDEEVERRDSSSTDGAYSKATDEDYSDFGDPSVDVSRR